MTRGRWILLLISCAIGIVGVMLVVATHPNANPKPNPNDIKLPHDPNKPKAKITTNPAERERNIWKTANMSPSEMAGANHVKQAIRDRGVRAQVACVEAERAKDLRIMSMMPPDAKPAEDKEVPIGHELACGAVLPNATVLVFMITLNSNLSMVRARGPLFVDFVKYLEALKTSPTNGK